MFPNRVSNVKGRGKYADNQGGRAVSRRVNAEELGALSSASFTILKLVIGLEAHAE
jgi:hypothetical protein